MDVFKALSFWFVQILNFKSMLWKSLKHKTDEKANNAPI